MIDAAKLPAKARVGAEKLAAAMFGPRIKGLKASRMGDPASSGIYADGGRIGRFDGPPVPAGDHKVPNSAPEVMVNGDSTIPAVSGPIDPQCSTGFSQRLAKDQGIADAAFVSDMGAPCFVEGSRIETDRGPVPVEDIAVGDLVLTLDHGYQPVAWHGIHKVPATGSQAPVHIPAALFGDHGALAVSPQHRLHFCGWRTQLYAGEDEVLVKAIDLVRAGCLAQDHSSASVSYHHLLFARHEIIRAEGLWAESCYPGPETIASHATGTQKELLTLFPNLAKDPGSYGPSARPAVRGDVAALLVN